MLTRKNWVVFLLISASYVVFHVAMVPIALEEVIQNHLILTRVIIAVDITAAVFFVLGLVRVISRCRGYYEQQPTTDRLLEENRQLREQIKNTNDYAMMVLQTLQASLDAGERGWYFPEA